MKTRKTLLYVASLIFLVLQGSSTAAAQDVAAAARANRAKKAAARNDDAPRNEWYHVTRVSLSLQGQDAAMTTLYEFADNEDVRITVQIQEKGRRESGQIMLINGRCQWMLAKGMPLDEGYEIDALDVPVLDLKLALELLRAAVPGGPSEIKEKMALDVKENSLPITVNTASANGGLEAPWVLHAIIEPTAANEWSFELTVKSGEETMQMSGTWQKATPSVFGDDMLLDGWQILGIGPIVRKEGTSTILDYGAQPSTKRAKTLGELRRMTTD